jgi:light-regulated signal transduction histidine kinase (bacteriophytochrome)
MVLNHNGERPESVLVTFTEINKTGLSFPPTDDELDNDELTPEKIIKIRSTAASNALPGLINRLNDYLRISGAHPVSEIVNTNQVVREVIRSIGQASGARVTFRIGQLPDCFGNRNLIQNVFLNLIDNAMKATAHLESPSISVIANIDDESVVFSVRDNGRGYDPALSDRLFRILEKLHGQEDFEGYGVGLAIVREIVQKHGGRVWAESCLGSTTFSFALPVEKRQSPRSGATVAP